MKKILALLITALLTSCSNITSPAPVSTIGDANVTITVEHVGTMAKATAIALSKLYITLTASGETTVSDSITITGTATQVVNKTYTLASLKTWKLTATSKDTKGTIIHSGSTTFQVSPGTTNTVSLSLAAKYSMLVVNFTPIRDSVNECKVTVDGTVLVDSTFAIKTYIGKTITIRRDYLTASTAGTKHFIILEAYGRLSGQKCLLYRGSDSVTAVSGQDRSYTIQLVWVGPNTSAVGQGSMVVTLGTIGTTTINGILNVKPAGKVLVPGGTLPASPCTVSAFYIDTIEVTQGQFMLALGINPSQFSGNANLPVERVTWTEAALYCNALSKQDGFDTVYQYSQKLDTTNTTSGITVPVLRDLIIRYNVLGYRLPTEAEWEYACRGGSAGTYAWGEDGSIATVGQYAWYLDNATQTHVVATKASNNFGLYDMSGNVWEWCNDIYSSAVPTGLNPKGPVDGTGHVIRGGGWGDSAPILKPSWRSYADTGIGRWNDQGFRTVLSIK